MTNRVRELRERKGLTQAQLAELAETSQQQIQRVETGRQQPRVDLVARICTALEVPVERVFPMAKPTKALRGWMHRLELGEIGATDEAMEESLYEAGIESTAGAWNLQLSLRGGGQATLRLQERGRQAFWRDLDNPFADRAMFNLLDTRRGWAALNLNHLVHSFVEFDPWHTEGAADVAGDASEEPCADMTVRVYCTNRAAPYTFRAVPDIPDEEDGVGEVGGLFIELEGGLREPHEFVLFQEHEGGEWLWFRVGDIALIEAPWRVVQPDRYDISGDAAASEGTGTRKKR